MGIYEFKREDAERFAREREQRIKVIGDELQLRECPYCHGAGKGGKPDTYTFAINLSTGAFNCKRASCNAKGNMLTLAKDFNFRLDNYTEAYYHRDGRQYKTLPQRKPETKDAAIAYLAGRGISTETAKAYRVTVSNKDERIMCFPFYDEDDVLQFVKYRNLDYKAGEPGNKEWCESNCKPILFGMHRCKPDAGPLVITEGQIDSLSVAECGIPNAVSVPNGKNGFTWIPYCWDFLHGYPEIIIFGDCEHDEITLLDEISRRFRFTKTVRHVRIEDYRGHKDANELLQAEGPEAVRQAIERAKVIENPRIKRVADIKPENRKDTGGVQTGFAGVDELIERLYYGQLVLLTGERGQGKSTLAMQIGARAVDAGIPTVFYSGELTEVMFQEWIERQFAGKGHIIADSAGRPEVNPAIVGDIRDWYRDRLYLYDNNDMMDDEEQVNLIETLRSAAMQYGCKLIVIDNLMTAIDDDIASDLYRQQSNFVKQLARMAKELSIIVLLVAHPRKSTGKEFDNDDVSGSANITNLCDIVLRYAKPKGESKDTPERVLCVIKNRINGRVSYEGVPLYFEDASKRISAAKGRFDYVYGWETGVAAGFASADDLDVIPF